MAAEYPQVVKAFTTKPGKIKWVMAVDVNNIQDEVDAVESTLGTNPFTMVDKDPNQTTPWNDISGRMDALDIGWTTPVFGSWIGGIDEIAIPDSVTPGTYTGGVTTTTKGSSYTAYLTTGYAYSAPGNLGYNTLATVWDGVQMSPISRTIRSPGTTSTTPRVYHPGVTILGTRSPVDNRGIFLLPKPQAKYDPLNWYNGVNGFVVRKTGFYHLSARVSWQATDVVTPETTRRFTIFGNDIPLANVDTYGEVADPSDHKKVEWIGVVQAGTTINIGIDSFIKVGTGIRSGTNACKQAIALSPQLSGVFLRGA